LVVGEAVSSQNRLRIGAALVLIAVTILAYAPIFRCDFVNFDDPNYVTENANVQAGLSIQGVAWAFTTTHASYWHPLTWLSLQLDTQLYGFVPRGYHLTNLLLHTVNSVLLFWVLCRMTGATWPSFLVAALFALHPLHVESVAWVTERKDVLSTLFGLLALAAYVVYTQRPGLGRYLCIILAFTLSLLAKPMLVTLPFVLLLLDYWPLGRWTPSAPARVPWRRLLWEKFPLLGLSVASSITIVLAQHGGEALRSLDAFPLAARIENAILAWVIYLGKAFWPVYLGVFYPHARQGLPLGPVVAAGFVLVGITAVVVREARRRPYLMVGWLWYLGTLVPVIGLVQAGSQALADRFTYVPLIGVFLMVAWGLEEWRQRYRSLAVLPVLVLSACAVLTWIQVGYWHDSRRLWEHTLQVTGDNYLAHWNLADFYLKKDPPEPQAAVPHMLESVRIRPLAGNHLDTANVLFRLRKLSEAAIQYRKALQLDPNSAEAYNNLGTICFRQGKLDEAHRLYGEALRLEPFNAQVHRGLGWAYLREENWQRAVEHLTEAVRLDPRAAEAFRDLGEAYLGWGRIAEAIPNFREAVRLEPADARFQSDLAAALERAESAEVRGR
jgi:tetratricopeptide (TPR) repeat protein